MLPLDPPPTSSTPDQSGVIGILASGDRLTVSLVFKIGDKLPDIVIALGQFPAKTYHSRSLDAVEYRMKNLLIAATVQPVTIEEIGRLCGAGCVVMTITAAGSCINHLTTLYRGSIIE